MLAELVSAFSELLEKHRIFALIDDITFLSSDL